MLSVKRSTILTILFATLTLAAHGEMAHQYDFQPASLYADTGLAGGLDVAPTSAGSGGPAPVPQAAVTDGAGTTRYNAMRFSGGATNYIYLRNSTSVALGDFSLSLWARADTVNQGTYKGLFSAGTTGNSFQIDSHNGQFRIVGQSGVSMTLGAIPQDRWQHIVMVFDGTQTLAYWNGALAQTAVGDPGSTLMQICIGSNRSINNGFSGDLDDLRIYDGALDAAAVAAIYQGTDEAPTLRHYYDFANGSFGDTGQTGALDLAAVAHNSGGGPAALATVTDATGLTRDGIVRFTGGIDSANWSYLANNTAAFTTPFTIALWTRTDLANQGPARALFNNGSGVSGGLQIDSNNGTLRLSGPLTLDIGASTADRWQLVAVTYDDQDTAVWLDGVETARLQVDPGSSFTRIQLGVDRADTTAYAGDIDDAAVWTNALDATRMRALYELGRHPALRYSQGDAARLFDHYATASAQVLTLNGTPWEYAASGLAGGLGITQDLGDGNIALQLDASGSGLRTLIYPANSEAGEISELMAINSKTLADEDGDFSDWIEIHNRSTTQSLNLTGWYLTDDPLDLTKWPFPSGTTVYPDRYLVVFASGKNRGTADTGLHTNFALNASGEYLALVKDDSPTPRVIHPYAPNFPPQIRDYSYGLLNGSAYHFSGPTPGAPNASGTLGVVPVPQFSIDHGFFDAPITLALACVTPAAAIRYTTDGSAPSVTSGTLYTAPFQITDTSVVRAVASLPAWLDSPVNTRSYIYLQSVIAQTRPPNYPTTWGGVTADYDMDPDVIGPNDLFGGKYAATILNDLQAIPTLSIVMDKFDLFDPATGLYENPGGDGANWERPTSAELIRPDGRPGFQINCGIRIAGGSSRSTNAPKHSFRLLFKSDYGPTKLNYPLFEDQPHSKGAADKFDTLILRAGHNNTWHHWHYWQNSRAMYVRDQFVRDTQNAMGWHSPHGLYTHLYINGLYWGIYNVTERATADFMTSYYGGEKEDYDTQNVNQVKDGNALAWNAMMAMANAGVSADADYLAIQDYLDPVNLADYMLINFYFGNDDWDGHNWYAGRKRNPIWGYQFFCWDSELIISRHQGGTPPPVPEEHVILNRDRTGLSSNNKPSRLHQKCALNAEYRLMFADRIHRHMFNGGVLTTAANQTRWMERTNQVRPAAVAESARWGDYRRDVNPRWNSTDYDLYTRDEYFDTHLDWIMNDYLVQRHDIVLQQLRNRGLYPSTAAPTFTPQHGGEIPPGSQQTISAPAGTIYYTLDGSDPRQPGGAPLPTALIYTGAPLTLNGPVYLSARANNGGVWSALNAAVYTIAGETSALTLSELMYNPLTSSQFEYLELHNPHPTDLVVLDGYAFTNGIDYTFPPGTVIPPGGYLLVTSADPAGNFAAFRAHYGLANTVPIAGPYAMSLSNSGEQITLRTSASGPTALSFAYNDARGWPLPPDGGGHSLVPLDEDSQPTDSLDYGGNWRSSTFIGGSPGATDPTPPDSVLLNEFAAHTDAPLPPPFDSNDWIEIHNPTPSPITLNDYYLSDDVTNPTKWAITNGTPIPAGAFLDFDEVSDFHNPTGFGLNKAGEQLILSHLPATGPQRIVDALRFKGQENSTTLGRSADGDPYWFPMAPTRGVANAAPNSDAVFSEIMYHSGEGTTVSEYLEIHNPTDQPIPLWNASGPWRLSGGVSYTFPPNTTLQPNSLLLILHIDPTDATALAAFKATYGLTTIDSPAQGPYSSDLSNHVDRIALERPQAPDQLGDSVSWVIIDEIYYFDQPPFPVAADGGGSALQRQDPARSGNEPANWRADTPSPGVLNLILPPTVNLLSANSIDIDSATLNANLLSTGGEAPIVRFYWGATDGAKAGKDWQHYHELGTLPTGPYSHPLDNLTPSTHYYFQTYAFNSTGHQWGTASGQFTTLAPSTAHTNGIWLLY